MLNNEFLAEFAEANGYYFVNIQRNREKLRYLSNTLVGDQGWVIYITPEFLEVYEFDNNPEMFLANFSHSAFEQAIAYVKELK